MPMPPKKGSLPKFEDFEDDYDDLAVKDLTDEDFEDDHNQGYSNNYNPNQSYNFNNTPDEGFNFGENSTVDLNKESIPLYNQQHQYNNPNYGQQNYNQQDFNQPNYNQQPNQNFNPQQNPFVQPNYQEYNDPNYQNYNGQDNYNNSYDNYYEGNEEGSYEDEMNELETQGSPIKQVKGLGTQLLSKFSKKAKNNTNQAIKKKPKLLIPIAIVATLIVGILIFFIAQKFLPQRATVESPTAKQANTSAETSEPVNKSVKDTEVPVDYAISYPNIEITAKKENLQGSMYLLYKDGDKLVMCSTVENSYEKGKAKTVELSCQGSDNLINAKLQQTYFIKSN